jgi:hypothetical protein
VRLRPPGLLWLRQGTACTAALEGFDLVGIEQDQAHAVVAWLRREFWALHGEHGLEIVRRREALEPKCEEVGAAGQLSQVQLRWRAST